MDIDCFFVFHLYLFLPHTQTHERMASDIPPFDIVCVLLQK